MAVSCMALKRMDVDFQMVDVTEIDPKCHRMIAALRGQARRSHYDITRRKQIGHAHLWMVTAPCQDFSTENGKRSGCKSRRRGKLIKSSMKALKKLKPKHRPRAIVFENVATWMTHKRHRRVIRKINKVLKSLKYRPSWKLMSTAVHGGVPQTRRRTWGVAVQRKSLRKNGGRFRWPGKIKLRYRLGDVVKRAAADSSQLFKLPRTTFGTKSRSRVNKLVRQAKAAHFKNESQMRNRLESSKQPLMCDIDCSEGYNRSSCDGIAWTVTASRAASGGPFLIREGRRMDLAELCWSQGMDFHNDGIAEALQTANVTARSFGHMLGNATSLSLTERILRRVLISIGYLQKSHPDRWVDASLDAGPKVKRHRSSSSSADRST